MPRATLEGRDSSIAAFIADDPAKTAFYKPFERMPSNIPAATTAAPAAPASLAVSPAGSLLAIPEAGAASLKGMGGKGGIQIP